MERKVVVLPVVQAEVVTKENHLLSAAHPNLLTDESDQLLENLRKDQETKDEGLLSDEILGLLVMKEEGHLFHGSQDEERREGSQLLDADRAGIEEDHLLEEILTELVTKGVNLPLTVGLVGQRRKGRDLLFMASHLVLRRAEQESPAERPMIVKLGLFRPG